MGEIPHLTRNELVPLLSLRNTYPVEFNSNKTAYFISEHIRYVKERRVWRVSLMGETRGGKSEVGSTICFNHKKIFNKCLLLGIFDDLDLFKSRRFKRQKLTFTVDYVCDNQQIYKEKLKRAEKENKLKWGQIWQIDEKKDSEGGVGSISDLIESRNLSNIIAKFNQCEIWTKPDKFETNNCPFGLKVIKKDMVNRVNWCLLFKIESEPRGGVSFEFLGWVKMPLHTNERFRKAYNKLKDEWIAKELSGRSDERLHLRSVCANMLVDKYSKYFKPKDNLKGFKYSQAEQLTVLTTLIEKSKIGTNFNEQEKYYIIQQARLIAEDIYKMER